MAVIKETQKVLVLLTDEVEGNETLEELKGKAKHDFNMFEFANFLNGGENDMNYHFHAYNVNEDMVHVQMGDDSDSVEVAINKKLELHIVRNSDGVSVDAYKYFDGEDEDHDYDDDFIFGLGWVASDDYENDEEEDDED